MTSLHSSLAALADHMERRRDDVLQAWRTAIRHDPGLSGGQALPRTQMNDHIPSVLEAFEKHLRDADAAPPAVGSCHDQSAAAAHGLHRWQQGYDLREVTRELGILNEAVVAELDDYSHAREELDPDAMARARRIWASTWTADIEASTAKYFELQRIEAAGHVRDLEQALEDIGALEQQRAELWRQIVHDLRGNVGVVASVTEGLTLKDTPAEARERFLLMLDRNVKSLRRLLDDVTDLARLQAGSEPRRLTEMDVAALLTELCESLQVAAAERGLYLRHEGPAPFVVEGDPQKIRRIVQNLALNALKYTVQGGVTVTWEAGGSRDHKRWMLSIVDTGPGFRAGPSAPLTKALSEATELTQEADATTDGVAAPPRSYNWSPVTPQAHGEGLGLSIVKRLSELLDTSVEVESDQDTGTTFRLLFPVKYPS